MLVSTAPLTAPLAFLALSHTRFAPLRLCAADPLKRAADTSGSRVDLGDSATDASSLLENLAAGAASRLVELGASEAPPPPPPGFERSTFARSQTSDADRAAMDERLRRLRLKSTGELEPENQAAIEEAMKMSRQWATAGLHVRAKQELQKVEPFVSFRTNLGATFHMALAGATMACGEKVQARRLLQKVQTEAESSAMRWQAERTLDSSSPAKPGSSTSSGSSGSGSAAKEMSQLFKLPDQWS